MIRWLGKRAIVIGGDGAIGSVLGQALTANGAQVALSTRRPENVRSGYFFLDLAADPTSWQLPACDVAFVVAAITRHADCRAQPELARRTNVEAPIELVRRIVEGGGFAMFLSTNQIFSGLRPYYRSDEPASPRSLYGKLKAEAEAGLVPFGKRTAVVRLTKVIGPHVELFQRWQTALGAGREIEAFCDLIIAPIALSTVVSALLRLGELRAGGIWHVGGRQEISYFAAGTHLARRLGVSPALVIAASAADAGIPEEERAPHTLLDLGNMPAITGVDPGSALQEFDRGLALVGEFRI